MTPILQPLCSFLVCLLVLMTANARAGEILTVPGPNGPLEGEAILATTPTAGIVIVPGSGPTDRDGNGPAGLRSDSYKLLAQGLAEAGISTLRVDKRGFFGSSKAIADPEDVTIANYAGDLSAWHEAFAARLGTPCVWLAGHSEGGLIALLAAAGGSKTCGLVLLASPGRRISDLMREQFRNNPANAPYLTELDAITASLERGAYVEEEKISPILRPLFRKSLQRYMIDLISYDPAEVAKGVTQPVLILQGESDVQVTVEDAQRLSKALPQAKLTLLPGMTHMLKQDVAGAPFATYQNPDLPLDPKLVPAIASFVQSTPRD